MLIPFLSRNFAIQTRVVGACSELGEGQRPSRTRTESCSKETCESSSIFQSASLGVCCCELLCSCCDTHSPELHRHGSREVWIQILKDDAEASFALENSTNNYQLTLIVLFRTIGSSFWALSKFQSSRTAIETPPTPEHFVASNMVNLSRVKGLNRKCRS